MSNGKWERARSATTGHADRGQGPRSGNAAAAIVEEVVTRPFEVQWRPSGLTPSRSRLAALLAGAQICLASLMVIGREAVSSIPANVIATSRLVGGCLVFTLLARASPRTRSLPGDARLIFLCGALGVANQLLFLHGLAMSNATNASILSTSVPVFTVLVAWVLRAERPRIATSVGMALALAGALILVGPDRLSIEGRRFTGNVLILLNCVSWAFFLVLSRRLALRYPPMALAARVFAVGALLSVPLAAPSLIEFAPRFNGTAAAYLAFIIAIPTVATYGLNQVALPHVESSAVATYWCLLPILGTIGAAVRLGERPTLRVGLAGSLIGVGLFLSSRRRSPLPSS